MLERYRGGVLVIKHYAIGTRGTENGGNIKIYVAKPEDINDYNRGLVDDNGRVDIDSMVNITEEIARLFGKRTSKDGKFWVPGIGFNRSEYIAMEIQKRTNRAFDDRAIGVYGRGNKVS